MDNEAYMLHLSRYIHLNPSEYTQNLAEAYSSYAEYLCLRKTVWINTKTILAYFNQVKSLDFKRVNKYIDFVEKYQNKHIANMIDELTLE